MYSLKKTSILKFLGKKVYRVVQAVLHPLYEKHLIAASLAGKKTSYNLVISCSSLIISVVDNKCFVIYLPWPKLP